MEAHGIFLLLAALGSVVLLVVLVAVAKLNPFLTLMLVSLGLGVVAGMPAAAALVSFELGVGRTLGHIAIVVGLGTMLGKMLAESGGADQIAERMIAIFGERNVSWAMLAIAMIVGLPAFFEVGFVLLVPIAFTMARRTNKSMLLIALPMLAGLSVDHALVPPHPAALLAVTIFHASVGKTILLSLLVGIPTAVLAGPLYAMWLARRMTVRANSGLAVELSQRDPRHAPAPFGITLLTILFPVVLMALGGFAGEMFAHAGPAGKRVGTVLSFLGNDDIALLAGVLVSFITLGRMRGFGRDTILRFSNECLAPTAAITLLVGAGGGFGRVLIDSGVSQALVALAGTIHVPVLLFAWTLAALLRLATGSATVAMTTAAGIVAPIALSGAPVNPSLLAIATGAGSVIFSHGNDGGFWLVKEYFDFSIPETLKSWSVCETIISVCGLALCAALSLVM